MKYIIILLISMCTMSCLADNAAVARNYNITMNNETGLSVDSIVVTKNIDGNEEVIVFDSIVEPVNINIPMEGSENSYVSINYICYSRNVNIIERTAVFYLSQNDVKITGQKNKENIDSLIALMSMPPNYHYLSFEVKSENSSSSYVNPPSANKTLVSSNEISSDQNIISSEVIPTNSSSINLLSSQTNISSSLLQQSSSLLHQSSSSSSSSSSLIMSSTVEELLSSTTQIAESSSSKLISSSSKLLVNSSSLKVISSSSSLLARSSSSSLAKSSSSKLVLSSSSATLVPSYDSSFSFVETEVNATIDQSILLTTTTLSEPEASTVNWNDVRYNTSNPTVAFVLSNGSIDLHGYGTTIITMYIPTKYRTYILNKTIHVNRFIDERDNTTYKIIKIGSNTLFGENIRYEGFGGYSYMDDSNNAKIHGLLYPISIALNACPPGWHLGTVSDFQKVISYVTSNTTNPIGTALKSDSLWNKGNGLNEFDFNGLPSGSKDYFGTYNSLGEMGFFWTSNEDPLNDKWYNGYLLSQSNSEFKLVYLDRSQSYSVRCFIGD